MRKKLTNKQVDTIGLDAEVLASMRPLAELDA